MKRYKRFICITLIFTVLLIPFSRPKKAEAIVLTTSVIALLGLGALVTAGGIVAYSSPEMLEDVGTTIWNGISGFFTVKETLTGYYAEAKQNISWDIIQSIISKNFTTTKVVTAPLELPFSDTVKASVDNYVYTNVGTFNITGATNFTVSCGPYSKTTSVSYKPENIPLTLQYYQTATESVIAFKTKSVRLEILKLPLDMVGQIYNITADIPVTGDIINELPYDGSQVKAKEEQQGGVMGIPIGLGVDVGKDTSIPFDKPGTITDTKDLPIDVYNPDVAPSTDVDTNFLDWLLKPVINLLREILAMLGSLVQSLIDALLGIISLLFVPTIALDTVFNPIPSVIGPLISALSYKFNFQQKPLVVEWVIPLLNYKVRFAPFENVFLLDNLELIRNINSYAVLLATVFGVLKHALPRRDMD